MTKKVKLRLTVMCEYWADPKYYYDEAVGPREMSAIDVQNFIDDPNALFEFLEGKDYDVFVEPVDAD